MRWISFLTVTLLLFLLFFFAFGEQTTEQGVISGGESNPALQHILTVTVTCEQTNITTTSFLTKSKPCMRATGHGEM